MGDDLNELEGYWLIPCIKINTDKCTHILLNHPCINTTRKFNIFQPLEGHLQGVYLIYSNGVGQQNKSSDVKFKLVSNVYFVT